jgi:hypothetical protein
MGGQFGRHSLDFVGGQVKKCAEEHVADIRSSGFF